MPDPHHLRLQATAEGWADDAKPKLNGNAPSPPRFLTGAEFIAAFVPQRPLIRIWDMKRGWFYSLTAPTGGGKTAVALAIAIEFAEQGHHVAYLAGENPDDVRARVILTMAKLGIAELPPTLRFVDRTFNLADDIEHVRGEVAAMGGADLIIVDTSPAFHIAAGGIDENNSEMIKWAAQLRALTRLEGCPAVLALCHPIKRPESIEHCLPRGGGGFIAEVDGNYALWKASEDGDLEYFQFAWTGKFRGSFEPLTYCVEKGTCERLTDPDGQPIRSVWARRADEQVMESAREALTEDQNAVLMVMADHPGQSLTGWAKLLGWQGNQGKGRVDRALQHLRKWKLARIGRDGKWQLLDKGKTEAKQVAERMRKEAV